MTPVSPSVHTRFPSSRAVALAKADPSSQPSGVSGFSRSRWSFFSVISLLTFVVASIVGLTTPQLRAQSALDSSLVSPDAPGGIPGPKPKPTPTPKPDGESDWKNAGGTDWNTGANWTAVSGSAPPVAGDVAWFKTAFSSGQPNLSASTSIAGFYFNGTGSSGYDITSSSAAIKFTLTATGTTIGTELGNTTAVAIGAENTSGTNKIDAPIILGAAAAATQTIFQAGGGTLVINGPISEQNAGIKLSLTGAGTVTLAGANTYTGLTILSGGTLNINNAGAGGTSSAIGLGTLQMLVGTTIDNTSGGAITLSTNNAANWAGDFTFGGTNNLNFGTGVVILGSSRTITLNGTNSTLTFGGTATNTSGATLTLTVNGAGNNLSLGSMNLSNSGTSRTVSIAGSGNVAITGVVANGSTSTAGQLKYAGTGTLTLSGASTFAGGFTLNNGTLAIGANSTGAITNGPLGTGTFTLTGPNLPATTAAVQAVGASHSIANAFNFTTDWTANGSQNLSFTGTTTESNSDTLTNSMTGGAVLTFGPLGLSGTTTARTLTVAGTGNTTFAGSIANGAATGGNIIITNTGTTIFSAANSYAGTGGNGTTVGALGGPNAGTLRLSGAGTLGATTNPLLVRGGTVDLNGTTQTISTLLLGGGASASSANVTIGAGNLNLGGTVTYSATNNPNGATISGVGGGLLSLNGTQIFSVGDSTAAAADLTVSSIIQDGSSSSGISKQSAGTMVLSGANTYTGKTSITAGTLSINTIQNAGSSTPNSLGEPAAGANSIIDLAGTLQYTGSTAGSSDRVINLTGATGGAGSLDASGSTAFALSGGVTSAGTSGTTTLTLTGTGAGSESGVIADGTSPNVTALTKAGTGTWTLSGNNTYTGTTTINANGGTLNAAANGALGTTSSITVNSGGTLALSSSAATDRINNAAGISLAGGTILRQGPGTVSEGTGASTTTGGVSSTGTNTVGLGALTLTANSTLDFGSGTGGVGTLVFSSFTPNGNVLNIVNYTNTTASFPLVSGVDGTDDRLIFSTDQTANLVDFSFGGTSAEEIALGGGFFEIVPIPEPGTWLAGALGLVGVIAFSRRRFRRTHTPIAP